MVRAAPFSTIFGASGDTWRESQDTSFMREGSWSQVASGGIYTLFGELVMKYWSHNVSIDGNGNFLGRDDAGPCDIIGWTEGVGTGNSALVRFDAVTGAAGTTPAWTLSEIMSRTTATQVVNNNASATITLSASAPFADTILCTGTNVASVQFILPPVANLTDGFPVIISTQAAIGTASTFTSSGGAFVGAPATMSAGQAVRFIKVGTLWMPW